ncbi:MAG: SHOCT domain-containing protein [Acidimicrobiia bacterium]|nr:SHOCT domain-containing protein [Acidimicrobiia bacterium]
MPILDFFFAMLWFFLFIIWIWLLITVFIDIFRNKESSGWVKALWVIFIIILPLLGVLIYLIVEGGNMQKRKLEEHADMQKAQDDYIRSVSGSSSADQLEKLKSLHDQGALTDEEYAQQKAKVLNS